MTPQQRAILCYSGSSMNGLPKRTKQPLQAVSNSLKCSALPGQSLMMQDFLTGPSMLHSIHAYTLFYTACIQSASHTQEWRVAAGNLHIKYDKKPADTLGILYMVQTAT
jgi:hypothetical protein